MTKGRAWVAVGLFAASVLAGCDGIESGRQPLTAVVTQKPVADAGVEEVAPGEGITVAPGAPAPEAAGMCQQYCEALRETNVYYCLSHGRGDAASCAAQVASALAQCVPLRCPSLDENLCLEQCTSLSNVYTPVCASVTPAPGTDCPATPRDHDDACRAGCAAASP
jgi:hypothetical protein